MKKALLLILCILLVFSSCKKSDEEISVASAGYTCNGRIAYGNDIEISAKLKVLGGGIFKIEIISPENLSGLCFEFSENKCKTFYKDTTYENEIVFEHIAPISALNDVFCKLSAAQAEAEKQENGLVFKCSYNGSPATFLINENGFPKSLEIPNINLKAEFWDWKY